MKIRARRSVAVRVRARTIVLERRYGDRSRVDGVCDLGLGLGFGVLFVPGL